MKHLVGLAIATWLASSLLAAPPGPGYHARVTVSEPTRLDWTFVLANQSQARPPAKWTEGYDSTKQTYELFVPPRKDPRALLPLILFISPGEDPAGWKAVEKLARARGILFASPRGAGNNCPQPRRVRIVLDVLDDLRRHYPVDPDRTYLGGFSGGGRMASAIAFALPELFGGVLPVCAGGELREESWLRQRVQDRLSVALLTGEKDFNRGEVERLRLTFFREVGVRAKAWTQPGLGHGIPGDRYFAEAFAWLEQDLPRRQALGKLWPGSRLSAGEDGSRQAEAKRLLDEGKARLAQKGQLDAGLMQLKGVLGRWPDLAEAKLARTLLEEVESKGDRSWEMADLEEQRRFLLAGARALDAYATGDLPAQYQKERPAMLRQALEFYKQIADDQPDSPAGKQARIRMKAIQKLLGAD